MDDHRGTTAATSTSSIASSSAREIKTPASAPANFRVGNKRYTAEEAAAAAAAFGGSLGSVRENAGGGGGVDDSHRELEGGDGQSYHSSPLVWNNSPHRGRSRRELEQKIRHRTHRSRPAAGYFDHGNDAKDGQNKSDDKEYKSADAPLSKALTDILLQTAILGIDTTAKLSKPTLALTRNTILPQIILPLIHDLWEQYAPIRLQTWIKVVPSSLKNVGNLLWDTEPGKALGTKLNQLGDNALDMASSDVARQCWIDLTVTIIKIMEALHTPEVRALLDQYAVGMCRFVDVWSSGKAKQVWFDISDTIWAMLEVGSDPLVVMSLAEGCAQICFALEREREGLKQRKAKEFASDRQNTANRRRERDQRQRGIYPPGKEVVREGEGRENVERAFLDGLGNDQDEKEEEEEDGIVDDGPPRVILPTSPMNVDANIKAFQDGMLHPIASREYEGDSESEITTEIEDLRCNEGSGVIRQDNSQSIHSTTVAHKLEQQLRYEDGDDYQQHDGQDVPHENDGEASEMYDAFNESVLQFYHRMNEVLAETRKKSKLRESIALQRQTRVETSSSQSNNVHVDGNKADDTTTNEPAYNMLSSRSILSMSKKWWKLLLVVAICGVVITSILWFALGCYGFYVVFLGGGNTLQLSPFAPLSEMQQQPSPAIVIQLVVGQNEEGELDDGSCVVSKATPTISLDNWNKMKLDVDKVIRQTTG